MSAVGNPRISPFLQVLTWIEVLVVGGAAFLYFIPVLVVPHWPWALTPFNAFFVGATYLSAFVPLLIFARAGRWNPGRVVLPLIGTFTAYVLLVSFLDTGTYLWDRPSTYLWWVLYIILPISSAVHLWLYRRWPAVDALPTSPALRSVFVSQIVLSLIIGLGLLVSPNLMTSWWPWPVDTFNARLYGAAFFAFPAGSVKVFQRASRLELLTLGATTLTFGLGAVIGLAKTDLGLGRVNWTAPGTIAWEALFLFVAISGAATLLAGVRQRQISAQSAMAE